MLVIALAVAAAAAETPAPSGSAAVRQATASVRIISGARIKASEPPPTAIVTTARVHDADGTRRVVRLIEFP